MKIGGKFQILDVMFHDFEQISLFSIDETRSVLTYYASERMVYYYYLFENHRDFFNVLNMFPRS